MTGGLFDAVDAYEIAFGYRDIPAETDLLLAWFARHHGGVPASVLDLAAGPGDHALEFARRGIAATALDLSAAMCARAGQRAAAAGLAVDVVRADMTGFRLGRRFDLALLMLDSASLLLTDEAMTAFLDCVSRHLAPGGLLVIDLSVRSDDARRPDWTVEARGRVVRTRWGTPEDQVDPRTGVEQVHVRMFVTHPGAPEPALVVDEIVPARGWTTDRIRPLAPDDRLALAARHGSMGEAARDVAVFRRI